MLAVLRKSTTSCSQQAPDKDKERRGNDVKIRGELLRSIELILHYSCRFLSACGHAQAGVFIRGLTPTRPTLFFKAMCLVIPKTNVTVQPYVTKLQWLTAQDAEGAEGR